MLSRPPRRSPSPPRALARGHWRRLGCGLAVAALLSCGGPAAREGAPPRLMVFAAASLRDALVEVGEGFERASGVELDFNFAGSNVLALQIEGAPGAADVFLSADQLWTDHLDRARLLRAGERVCFLSNRLVVVAARTSPLRLETLADLAASGVRFVAVGHPEAVPAGRYARAALEAVAANGESLWSRIESRLAPAADVRAALALVEARDGTVGIVYATDARSTSGVRVLLEIPEGHAPSIGYFASVTRETRHPEAAAELVRHLTRDEARAIFARHGFELPAVAGG